VVVVVVGIVVYWTGSWGVDFILLNYVLCVIIVFALSSIHSPVTIIRQSHVNEFYQTSTI
jgi:hypothetical protein